MICLDDIDGAARQLLVQLNHSPPEIAIVLGSGLAGNPPSMLVSATMSLSDFQGFPRVAVAGHDLAVSVGTLHGRKVIMFHGRYHLYEGYSAWQVTAQVRLAAAIGCSKVLLTNAAGGINTSMTPGDFMLVTDHLNLTGQNPLMGREERRFLDLCNLYCADFYRPLRDALLPKSVNVHSGVLAWMTGPTYETPAEINLLEQFGANAVSMSTVPEAIIARHYAMKVCAISLIANPAAGRGATTLTHEDVLTIGSASRQKFHLLLEKLLSLWN